MPHATTTTAGSSPPGEPLYTPAGPVYTDILQMIGRTPMLEVKRLDTGPCRLFLKMELANPAGSIKDRIGLWMIDAAERDGRLDPKAPEPPTLVEGTAGNTGLGLGLVAAQRGYRLIVVVPDKMSQGKIRHLRAMGAVVHLTRSDVEKGHPEYYQDLAERLARETPNALYVNQFGNPDNVRAHEESTGPEIDQQIRALTGAPPDAFVCGVGSGGTLSGVGRALRTTNPSVRLILADPEGSILHPLINEKKHVKPGSWLVEGMGEDFVPPICDLDLADEAVAVTDKEAFAAARELLLTEGILAGSSSGCLLAGALRFCRRQTEPLTVVTLACDQGAKYLDKVFSEPYLLEQDLLDREVTGDLRDLIALRHDRGEDIVVKPRDSVRQAFKTLRLHNVPVLPVIDPDEPARLSGEISESIILAALAKDPGALGKKVSGVMNASVPALRHSASENDLAEALQGRDVAHIVTPEGAYLGLIPRSMLLARVMRRG